MGQKLIEFYNQAAALGQIKAKMRLAMLTTIPSTKAADEPDSDENIRKFQQAIVELKKEFHA
jgi:tellurite resistance protein